MGTLVVKKILHFNFLVDCQFSNGMENLGFLLTVNQLNCLHCIGRIKSDSGIGGK